MGGFLQFISEQNAIGLAFEKTTAKNINRWLSENGMNSDFRASRFKPGPGQRSENFPDVYVERKNGEGFFVECKQYSRANMINARFDLGESCFVTAKDEKYSGIADAVNKSDQFGKFRTFMTSGQNALGGARPIDVYLGEKRFDPKRLIPKYNKMVRNGLTEADCKEFDLDVIRESTAGALACALAWRLANRRTWDICRIKTDFGPYLLGKYGDGANVKYLQLGENLFVVDENDNPLNIDAPAFPAKVAGLFSLRFTPRFGVGGMYITPRSELIGKLESGLDFNNKDRWPSVKSK